MKRHLRLIFFSFLLVSFSLLYIQCSQLRVGQRGGSVSNDGSGGSGGSGGSDSDGDGIIDDDEGGSNQNGNDDDYSTGGGRNCLFDIADCNRGNLDDEDAPSARIKYKELEDRYGEGSVRLDIIPNVVEEFKLGYPTNYEVTRGRLFVNLNRVNSQKSYRGEIIIALEEKQSEGGYKASHVKLDSGGDKDSRYNIWGVFGNKTGFHGFFSDNRFGSVVLVVNEGRDSLEDVDGVREKIRFADGSVWFMNFRSLSGSNYKRCYEGGRYIGLTGIPRKPPKKCWFIGAGPFDCRAWKTGRSGVDTLRTLEPTSSISCYKKLATFEDLNIEEAFNTEHDDDEEIVITY